jgi:hypothetical protein
MWKTFKRQPEKMKNLICFFHSNPATLAAIPMLAAYQMCFVVVLCIKLFFTFNYCFEVFKVLL